ncbi:hypothetical protein EYV94_03125 [Puteibacter caeruleilacunae]|nr:hypothetical protein EYV94_03125 [Puteibacter caeruleilacunae]
MKILTIAAVAIAALFLNSCMSNENTVELVEKSNERKVDVMFDGELFTSYFYPTNVYKPVLWPVVTSQGTQITRHLPFKTVEGERTDHPHHVGIWFNYGDVNGIDYWNYSEAIPKEKALHYGAIAHQEVISMESKGNVATLKTKSKWVNQGKKHLDEVTTFKFINKGNVRIIDRFVILTAAEDIVFGDNKEGVVAIRVTSELELPSNKPITLTDAHGIPTKVEASQSRANGDYINKEGITGGDVWGKRSVWVKLFGKFGNEEVAVTIIDNPSNPGYPTYWHARGYGLFAANTLGQKPLSGGKDELNLSLKKGESVTFKYRMVISSNAKMEDAEINKLADEFAKQ